MPQADGRTEADEVATLGRPVFAQTLITRALDGDQATMAMLLSLARESEPHRLRTWARSLLDRAGLAWEPEA